MRNHKNCSLSDCLLTGQAIKKIMNAMVIQIQKLESTPKSIMVDFQQLFTPTLKGEAAENQAPFRDRGKPDFQLFVNL
ncbi:MAG: hypothetical protein JW973_02525 [Bacteroidales bacterium]|nr:hypothetical protein [Bacteroidales bacterium]